MNVPCTINNEKRRSKMKYGAKNQIVGTIQSIKKGDIMSLMKIEVNHPVEMGSVLTTESLEELNVKEGDKVKLIIKAIHVLPVNE
jgi:molybdate transport system regulatory protein